MQIVTAGAKAQRDAKQAGMLVESDGSVFVGAARLPQCIVDGRRKGKPSPQRRKGAEGREENRDARQGR